MATEPLNLDAIRVRADWFRANEGAGDTVTAYGLAAAAIASAKDVPALLAEIERLSTALGALRAATNHHLEVCTDQTATGRCPTCDSPEPRLHPATQEEGEVTAICRDSYHGGVR